MDTDRDDLDELLKPQETSEQSPHALYTAVLLLVKWIVENSAHQATSDVQSDQKRTHDSPLLSEKAK